jgi:hypothetical protein
MQDALPDAGLPTASMKAADANGRDSPEANATQPVSKPNKPKSKKAKKKAAVEVKEVDAEGAALLSTPRDVPAQASAAHKAASRGGAMGAAAVDDLDAAQTPSKSGRKRAGKANKAKGMVAASAPTPPPADTVASTTASV